MGFTALDGLMMGTRCGNIDPGVLLFLMEQKGMSAEQVSTLLYRESGLKGVSGISHDMRDLLASDRPEAKTAIELFCYQAARQLSGLIPAIGGLDILVFTAGIGENSAEIRGKICEYLSWLGVEISAENNKLCRERISTTDSRVSVYMLATDEEKIIAKHAYSYISDGFTN